jgi:hypothetical protein
MARDRGTDQDGDDKESTITVHVKLKARYYPLLLKDVADNHRDVTKHVNWIVEQYLKSLVKPE